jgi:monoamine oxidase
MPHTQLLSNIKNLSRRVAREKGFPPLSRRAFLTGSAAALGVPKARAAAPRIAIVGGGLAGLTCAFRLIQKGISATVYEANNRLGGRCWSLTSGFDDGQTVERGGELIDQGHKEIRQLAQELGLTLDNLLQAEPPGTEPFYCFDGASYPYDEAVEDLKSIWKKLHSDAVAASYPTTYYQSTARGRELDGMSIVDWIDESVPAAWARVSGACSTSPTTSNTAPRLGSRAR